MIKEPHGPPPRMPWIIHNDAECVLATEEVLSDFLVRHPPPWLGETNTLRRIFSFRGETQAAAELYPSAVFSTTGIS